MKKGVSIVICCYNSSKLLPDTLKALTKLSVSPDIPFEIIIVDNNSDDNTTEKTEEFFKKFTDTPFKILRQPVQGLSYARKMGIDNAEYEYIIFCDDDNWLAPDYVEISYKKMEQHEQAGAMGGDSEAVSDVSFPDWFERFQKNFSAGKQHEISGDITGNNNGLWGAGMVVRKSALDELYKKGYDSLLSDRSKSNLSSGGDIELCYALRLAGWKLIYEPSLKIRHFIPGTRLSWEYLRKLNRGFGAQKVGLEPYLKAYEQVNGNTIPRSAQKWQTQILHLIKKLRKHGIRKVINLKYSQEGDPEILSIEKTIGRLKELIRIRGEYNNRMKAIQNASWRKSCSNGKIN